MADDDLYCRCQGNVPVLLELNEVERAPLADGGHTSFAPMVCKTCGGIAGFPQSNLDLFRAKGDPDCLYAMETNWRAIVLKCKDIGRRRRLRLMADRYLPYLLGSAIGAGLVALRSSLEPTLKLAMLCIGLAVSAIVCVVVEKLQLRRRRYNQEED